MADEVRNLAKRAGDAAKNTTSLTEKTIAAVKRGNDLTEATRLAYRENIEISGKVGELVNEIAVLAQKQTDGIGQIDGAVAEMEKVTQQNVVNAEESASASEQLNARAEEMRAMVEELVALVGGRSDAVLHAKKLPRHRQADRERLLAPGPHSEAIRMIDHPMPQEDGGVSGDLIVAGEVLKD